MEWILTAFGVKISEAESSEERATRCSRWRGFEEQADRRYTGMYSECFPRNRLFVGTSVDRLGLAKGGGTGPGEMEGEDSFLRCMFVVESAA